MQLWAQHGQDQAVYAACSEAIGRNDGGTMTPLRWTDGNFSDRAWQDAQMAAEPAGWPEDEDLTAGTTPVRILLLHCGHVQWTEAVRDQIPPHASCGGSLCSTLSFAGAASTPPTSTLDAALPLDEHGKYDQSAGRFESLKLAPIAVIVSAVVTYHQFLTSLPLINSAQSQDLPSFVFSSFLFSFSCC